MSDASAITEMTPPEPLIHDGTLEVYLLGIVDFDAALFLQDQFRREILNHTSCNGVLLLCEHPPIVTVGRDAAYEDLYLSARDYESACLAVRRPVRGGRALVHSPGQVAAYPILPLQRVGCGLDAFRFRLEQAVINVSREQHVRAFRCSDEPGVFVREGQVAWLGAAVADGISSHGLFVNVAPDMILHRMVRSTSADRRQTSLAAARVHPVSMHAVREGLMRHIAEQFGYRTTHVYTRHPLLVRQRRAVNAAAVRR